LRGALAGVDVAYYLVHGGESAAHDFTDSDRSAAVAFALAAEMEQVKRIVYLGTVAPRIRPSKHLASRLEVGEILRGGEVPALELRAAMIVGKGGASWQIVRDLAMRLPFMVLPRWLESKSCPVALEDVVHALVDARTVPLKDSAWYDLPGPEALSGREILERVAVLRGRRLPYVRVPFVTPRLSAMWLRLITRAGYPVARELVLGLRHDLLPKDERYWELTDHRTLVTFNVAARRALLAEETESGPRSAGGIAAAIEERFVDVISPRA
jgi:uncharacterized protein YbjT (DUF2867 family)